MIQLILYSTMLMTSMLFMQMSHPLAMGLTLLIQTALICSTSGLMTQTFWFSYILFLIFLGGMLVLFIYVASLASNEMFNLSMKLMTMSAIIFMAITTLMFMNKSMIYQFIENNEMNKMMLVNMLAPEDSLNLMKLYNYPTNLITTMLILYLLITLVASVKITNLFYGPLRYHK